MDSINEFNDTIRSPEYQAVLIIDYDDGRMFPLTEDTPKCLLPVGNRRLLSYQLDMLAKSGISGVCVCFLVEYLPHCSANSVFFSFSQRFTLLLRENTNQSCRIFLGSTCVKL
jgi:ADP-glucose pyrophosphorylase